MKMKNDAELLRSYAEENSEQAFAELVRRYVDVVYFSALRQVGGDAHRAHDIAQVVFTDLARKAGRLSGHAVLVGWLYTSTHYAAAKAKRTESRRATREREAHAMDEINNPSPAADWEQLRPVLDEAMFELNERDREAVLLRFFEGRAFHEMGERLRLSEDAARMRVERALDKLRSALVKRGVSSTTAAFSLAMASQVGIAAPVALVSGITASALGGGGASAGATGLIAFFAMNKIPSILTGTLALAGVGSWVVQQQANAALTDELSGLRRENVLAVSSLEHLRRQSDANHEAAALRQDDVEFARLQKELAVVKRGIVDAAKGPSDATNGSPATLDRIPRVSFQPSPAYPEAAALAGAGGTVIMEFIVDTAGGVQQVKTVTSDLRANASRTDGGAVPAAWPSPVEAKVFEEAAKEALGRWKFDPGLKRGRMVNTRMEVPVTFSAEGRQIEVGEPALQPEKPGTAGWF